MFRVLRVEGFGSLISLCFRSAGIQATLFNGCQQRLGCLGRVVWSNLGKLLGLVSMVVGTGFRFLISTTLITSPEATASSKTS